jgi:ribokinase
VPARIVVVGSLNADLVVRLARFPAPGETVAGCRFAMFPGGKGANQACAVARLGGRVAMIGRVGSDPYGAVLRRSLRLAGVNVGSVQRDPRVATGVAAIQTDSAGQNEIVVVPGANGALRPSHVRAAARLFVGAGIVLVQLEIPVATTEAAARLAKSAGARVILDPAPAQPIPSGLLACVDYLTPNESELALLTRTAPGPLSRRRAGDLAMTLCRRGARKVLVKLGARGALLASPAGTLFWPAFAVRAVDTTAAGDAFNGAFAVALAAGRSDLDAGRFATAAAACSVQRPGAQPSLPTLREVGRFLNRWVRGDRGARLKGSRRIPRPPGGSCSP